MSIWIESVRVFSVLLRHSDTDAHRSTGYKYKGRRFWGDRSRRRATSVRPTYVLEFYLYALKVCTFILFRCAHE